jgi:hypothetical protein
MTNENDWVTQDVVPDRPGIDEWYRTWPQDPSRKADWQRSQEGEERYMHGHVCEESGSVFQVRCKRKDHPVLGKVGSRFISQDELNAATRTRAWTFGTPAQTGHFLISFLDPALGSQEITATSIWNVNEQFGKTKFWFIYLGQTSDFADPIVQKAKYTLLTDPKEPNGAWLRRPDEIQDALSKGWLFVTEREFEVPEWD